MAAEVLKKQFEWKLFIASPFSKALDGHAKRVLLYVFSVEQAVEQLIRNNSRVGLAIRFTKTLSAFSYEHRGWIKVKHLKVRKNLN